MPSIPVASIDTVAVVGFAIGVLLPAGCLRNGPRVEVTEKPFSLSAFKALGKDNDLPVNATNIVHGQATVGMIGRAILYRFSAPPKDCLRYAQRLAILSGGRNLTSNSKTGSSPVKLATRPAPLRADTLKAYGLDGANWFSIDAITNGYSGSAPPDGLGLTWVDSDNDTFYYFWTD
jgi:hypothetical protein